MKKAKIGKVLISLIIGIMMLFVLSIENYASTNMSDQVTIMKNNDITTLVGDAGIYQTALNASMNTTRKLDTTIANTRTKYGIGEELQIRFSFSRAINSYSDLKLGLKFGSGTERIITETDTSKNQWYTKEGSYITFHYKIQAEDTGGLELTFIEGTVTDSENNSVSLGLNDKGAYWKNTIVAKGNAISVSSSTSKDIVFSEKCYILDGTTIRNIKESDVKIVNTTNGTVTDGSSATITISDTGNAISSENKTDLVIYVNNVCDIARKCYRCF